MNNFNTIQCLQDYYNSIEKGGKPFSISSYYNTVSFIPHCLSLFASIHLVRRNGLISMLDTMNSVSDMHKTPDSIISKESLSNIITICAFAPRSKLMNVPALANPTHGGFTPLFMYAHKLYNNVEYCEWDKDDEAIEYALGKTLYESLVFSRDNDKPIIDNAAELRTLLMTFKTGKKKGIQDKCTSYKMTAHIIDEVKYPANILRMVLQTWIANSALRDKTSMILDIWDWNNVPAPLDVEIEKPAYVQVDPGRRSRPW